MGPFVPDIITDQLNLVVALLVGIAFGFILEQAGFSSPRKLTGLFYGRDFTVLRVFFTAGVTAMIGVLLLGRIGVLDLNIIFINPTFLSSAIVGGLIMGVGFVVGGYCPGTSFCAAAVGRLDGMVFVGGGLLGAFAFGEAFPNVQHFYTSGSMGDIALPAALGVSTGAVVLAWVATAIVAFVVTGRIERKLNPDGPMATFDTRRHALAAVVWAGAAVVIAGLQSPETRVLARVESTEYQQAHPVRRVTADEVAFRLLDEDGSMQLLDVRSAAQFTAFSLPRAINVSITELFGKAWQDVLLQPRDLKVFFADDEGTAETAAAAARELGYTNVAVLQGGLRGFRADILATSNAGDLRGLDSDTREFRRAAAPRITALIEARGDVKPVVRKIKKVAGGCGI